MAHLIANVRGKDSIAFVGETPWHGLGQELQPGASIETWQDASGLSYDVVRSPVRYVTADGTTHTMRDRFVLHRSDNGHALGVVSGIYKPVQPGEVLEFFRDLCDEQGFQLETAGALKDGAVYWALAKTGHEMDVGRRGKSDRIGGYLLLSTSADGSQSTEARFTSVRVVCNNTLTIALGERVPGVARTSHVSKFDPKATKQALGVIDYEKQWDAFRQSMLTLQDISVTDRTATEYFAELLRPKADRAKARQSLGAQSLDELLAAPVGASVNLAKVEKEPVERAIRGLSDLEEVYRTAPGAQPGTAYGLVQAVTRYVDHERGQAGDKRLTSAWFGTGHTMKQKALDAALALAE